MCTAWEWNKINNNNSNSYEERTSYAVCYGSIKTESFDIFFVSFSFLKRFIAAQYFKQNATIIRRQLRNRQFRFIKLTSVESKSEAARSAQLLKKKNVEESLTTILKVYKSRIIELFNSFYSNRSISVMQNLDIFHPNKSFTVVNNSERCLCNS